MRKNIRGTFASLQSRRQPAPSHPIKVNCRLGRLSSHGSSLPAAHVDLAQTMEVRRCRNGWKARLRSSQARPAESDARPRWHLRVKAPRSWGSTSRARSALRWKWSPRPATSSTRLAVLSRRPAAHGLRIGWISAICRRCALPRKKPSSYLARSTSCSPMPAFSRSSRSSKWKMPTGATRSTSTSLALATRSARWRLIW